jgi:hypothetical protein
MRKRWVVPQIVVLLMTVGCAAGGRPGQRDGWAFLGERQVTDRLDHDRIVVTGMRSDFTRIKLTVQRAPVDFRRVVVHFANGADQEVQLRSTVRAGGETRAIDLRGGDRVIRNVDFWYDANTIRGRTAMVRLFGRR